jgi:hypothetical protein
MTPNNRIDLNSNTETLRTSIPIDDARDLDRFRADRASTVNFNEARYLDTPPMQHMTTTWGS